jgi:hypothetical protein
MADEVWGSRTFDTEGVRHALISALDKLPFPIDFSSLPTDFPDGETTSGYNIRKMVEGLDCGDAEKFLQPILGTLATGLNQGPKGGWIIDGTEYFIIGGIVRLSDWPANWGGQQNVAIGVFWARYFVARFTIVLRALARTLGYPDASTIVLPFVQVSPANEMIWAWQIMELGVADALRRVMQANQGVTFRQLLLAFDLVVIVRIQGVVVLKEAFDDMLPRDPDDGRDGREGDAGDDGEGGEDGGGGGDDRLRLHPKSKIVFMIGELAKGSSTFI